MNTAKRRSASTTNTDIIMHMQKDDVDTFSHLQIIAVTQSKAANGHTSTGFISKTCNRSSYYRETLHVNSKEKKRIYQTLSQTDNTHKGQQQSADKK